MVFLSFLLVCISVLLQQTAKGTDGQYRTAAAGV